MAAALVGGLSPATPEARGEQPEHSTRGGSLCKSGRAAFL